ncbi:MAG: 5'/3'-nucleotidase SurE [Pseudomonadota bacterium]|nr:MAG: 5'/3'-nucleotidase SurE [Pseudomonadota bacterium]
MRVLISNDDGITSPGLALLAEAARARGDEVWIVAPERKWTAASHQLSFDRDIVLTRHDERTYACSGAPADCVVAALSVLMAEARPDLVLSGINDGRNVGEDMAYSGTMAIAREAAMWGLPALAFSRTKGGAAGGRERDAVRALIDLLWAARGDWHSEGTWLSVNLPKELPAPLAGARIGRDKIASAMDVTERDGDRITCRIRRGRPHTLLPGDENTAIDSGHVTIVRHCWFAHAPLDDATIAGWAGMVK